MMVFNTMYGVAHWSAYFTFPFWRLRLKISRHGAQPNYKVNIPENKYWVIKVWTSYRVFTYTAKVGTVQIATGKSWYPNGLVILHTEHNS